MVKNSKDMGSYMKISLKRSSLHDNVVKKENVCLHKVNFIKSKCLFSEVRRRIRFWTLAEVRDVI